MGTPKNAIPTKVGIRETSKTLDSGSLLTTCRDVFRRNDEYEVFRDVHMKEGRVIIFDGAMGTMLAASGVPAASFGDELNLSNPRVVSDIHRAYLAAGADFITTNTFGSSRIALTEHGLGDKVVEVNKAAAAIAKKEASAAGTKGQRRFVAGELGPTSKLPTLGQIGFDELFNAYVEQASVLIEAGVDAITIATCQDPLQVKAAASAAREVMLRIKGSLPLFISVTIEKNGTMLLGTELSAVLAAVASFKPDAFGLNCATGPEAMEGHLAYLARLSPFPILCRPNAGIPENIGGRATYPLDENKFASLLSKYTAEYNLTAVGGCCGTTPKHIARLVEEIKAQSSKVKAQRKEMSVSLTAVSSLYSSFNLDQEPRPFIVAEQTNANGSKKFRDILIKGDFDAMADLGAKAAGACHALDVCVAYAGRDEVKDMKEVVSRLAVKSTAAIMVDSTNPDVIEAALKLIPGRAIINSINLEDGGVKPKRILALARKFGAVVVALTINEKGMARTADEKIAVGKELIDLAVSEGLAKEDIFLDVLTFTLASGDKSLEGAALETLEAIRRVGRELCVRTVLGVSNISYGLAPRARRIVTSVFLNEAIKAGLSAAIINPSRVLPIGEISEEEFLLASRLMKNDRSRGDPLKNILNHFADNALHAEDASISSIASPPEEDVKKHIIEGCVSGLEFPLGVLLEIRTASEIINSVLLPAMQEVGKSFAEGKTPLPFVLSSAEAMRVAIDIVSPHMEAGGAKGTIVLATVRGDVHDIGKNLVDVILSNNGYRVVNLGVKKPIQSIIDSLSECHVDAVGLSGLLVSSTEVMKEDLAIMEERGIKIPVLLGGAALTQGFVEKALSKVYSGRLYYCADAFAGLRAMDELVRK